MRIITRPINISTDKNLILDYHCQINYESDSPWARRVAYEQYRDKWFSTSQPNEFFSYFEETLLDKRTIAEIWLDETNEYLGYFWVVFSDMRDYSLVIAEVMDVLVNPKFQKRGIGYEILTYIEKKAIEQGANLLRSGTGSENFASQKLHQKFGFETYRVEIEKKLK